MTFPNAVFSAFSFTGFLMCVVAFPWQIESWNTGTCLYMAWAGLGCLNQFVNSVIWNHNYVNWSPVWCDISTKFMIGLNVGIPAAGLCICRRLYHIASLRSVAVTEVDKRRNVVVDLFIGLGLPLLEMVLHYIVQGHRFNIYEDVGCNPSTYATWPALIIIFCPPIVIGLISAVYATFNIIHFRRISTKCIEFPGHSNLTSSRYQRFLYLSASEILFTIPIASYDLYVASSQLSPWISWADTHSNFSRVIPVPAVLWRGSHRVEGIIELSRWIVVFCAFVFFCFFGLTAEARRNYRSCIQAIATRLGLKLSLTSRAPKLAPLVFQSPPHHTSSDAPSKVSDSIFSSFGRHHHLTEPRDCEKGQISTSASENDSRVSITHVLSYDRPSTPNTRPSTEPAFPRSSYPSQ